MFARTCALVVTCAAAVPATAAPITTLHSTGQGPAFAADPHYALVSAPGGFSTAVIVNQTSGFPFNGFWASNGYNPPDTPASCWIAPTGNVNTTHPDGYYTYRTTFDLTGLNPATAAIAGHIAADNAVDVFLNGLLVASIYAANGYSFTQASFLAQTLDIQNGFVSGQNTLDFKVYNEVQATGNPTGLRVGLAGTADPLAAPGLPTPEPATLAVFGAGLIGLVGTIRRRRFAG